jgi:hypothetical protein
MSAALLADIITAWQADATLTAVAGPWLGIAKDGAEYPYATIQFVGDGTDEHHFDGTVVEEPHARVTIFHTTASTLLDYLRAMDNLFIHAELGDSTGTTTDKFVRGSKLSGSRTVNALAKPAADGSTVYFATGLYAFKTQRTLP